MEAQQRYEIGQRIKELRNASPQTNRSIADYVGVGERAVAQWIAGGGIAWENAKKVADLFDVNVQWLWSGKDTPDLMGEVNGTGQLDRIESTLSEIQAAQLRIEETQAYFNSVIRAGQAQAGVDASAQDRARAEKRPARRSSATGRQAKAR